MSGARTALALAVFAVTAVTATTLPQVALGEERQCRGLLGGVAVDNLRVPKGATCVLNDTRVRGAITVQRGNLECKENRPAPAGARNRVGESKLHQCRGL